MALPASPPAASDKAAAKTAVGLRICDVPLSITGLPPSLRERFGDLMRPFLATHDPIETPHRLVARKRDDGAWEILTGERVMGGFGSRELLLEQLEWHAITAALQATSAYAVIHGATLVRGSSVVLLLAESGAGKTTLTLGLMGRGWQPLSDDITLVERETLAVSPFPRCFHVDDASRALAADESLVEWPAALGDHARPLQWATQSPQPNTVLVVERCVTCPTRLRALSLAEAAAAIGTHSLRGALSKAELTHVAVRLAMGARNGGRLNNGNLGDALDLIEAVSQH